MTPPSLNESSSILIVGAGTWGCSTALHLVRRGYKNVTVLDPYPVPSSIAAGNDVNKIMEHKELKGPNTDARSIAFATCTRSALGGWTNDPIFKPYFHGTGLILSVYEAGDVIGARTADDVVHRADHTILAAGAGSDRLLDFKKQLRPTAWTLSHIQMTAEESQLYRNLPVLFNVAKGFFMEPDEDEHHLKICDEHPGYCKFIQDPNNAGEMKSSPFAKEQIPLEAEARAREFLRDTMPHLAERPFVFARICWDADTPDRAFLIDRHPDHPSLIVAVGGSGNGAMQMPTIGGFIVDALEGKLQKELKDVVRWRPELAVNRDWKSTQNRFGDQIN
ncbi:hypothetical protein N7509_004949 [Penicillium cosmopolitanum]|uniref:FAD dependent oxidoreductase domain-containing protein n=1 Tax=Penicillium cosmopolitanum TaxID=1131564 RepID=A0A9W9W1N2_9EURO|nr:uncharacterized protein N7509_004949 [Penicillium cosmopolitanum]KAJ5396836.1 hypothetical protein N7509_004949 [Penicillium cosmopolitanum]